jgi:hypothetical protein
MAVLLGTTGNGNLLHQEEGLHHVPLVECSRSKICYQARQPIVAQRSCSPVGKQMVGIM